MLQSQPSLKYATLCASVEQSKTYQSPGFSWSLVKYWLPLQEECKIYFSVLHEHQTRATSDKVQINHSLSKNLKQHMLQNLKLFENQQEITNEKFHT